MKIVTKEFLLFNVALTLSCCVTVAPAHASDQLAQGFETPPQAAKPRVWWHWMSGNVTEEGVKLDLEWMKRVGIGGLQNFDATFNWGAAFDIPPQVDTPLTFLTPQWRQMLRYSSELAGKLGLEFTIPSSPGFSATGGPWVEPRQAMKKLVWSTTYVTGGAPFKGRLAQPPQTTGPFQNIPLGSSAEIPQYYSDVVTIAYRAPASGTSLATLEPSITSSSGSFDAVRLSDGDLAHAVSLPFGEGRHAWIQFSFRRQQRVQAVTAVIDRPSGFDPLLESSSNGWLEASDDGRTFRKVADLPKSVAFQSSALQQTGSFLPVVARVFRVVLDRPEQSVMAQGGLDAAAAPMAHRIAELVLHSDAHVHRFEDKAGYSTRQIVHDDDTPPVAPEDTVRKSEIVDLTNRMRADGSLDWAPPAGRWIVLRFGYSLTGRTNHPASREATGLEVDKLNRKHVRAYIETYLSEYEKTLGATLTDGGALQYMLTDSYEAGPQNWTDDMLQQFKARRGYDALPWLPVLTGSVVESAIASDRFLWDFRKTLGELMAEAHYGQISESLHEHGLKRYGESHERLRALIGDGMEAKKTADIPMGAIWAAAPPYFGFSPEAYDADIRESASVAHIYGKNIVAAESFTALGRTYGFAPQDLKPIADRAMAMGLNRFVIHTSVHQPDSKPGPGIGLGPFGQWFTRKETWAEQAGAWIGYLTRSSYLLQQGRFVADIAYLYGEDTNLTSLYHASAPPIPAGHDFDFINTDALLNETSVKDGRLVTRAGMEYRVLALDASTSRLCVPVLRKIRDLVRAGAIVVGKKPFATPSLADDENEFDAIVAELWGNAPGTRVAGLGKVFADHSLSETLQTLQISADVIFTKAADAELRFVHRTLPDADLYFVSNSTARPQDVVASFRVSGRKPELWRADSATITSLPYRIEHGRTIVPMRLEPNDAVFVVLRQPANVPSVIMQEPVIDVLATLQGPWDVSFAPRLGAPPHARFNQLYSWTDNADAGVKYFSGTATYAKTVRVSAASLQNNARVRLDLGEVKNLAEVIVNGQSMGVLWKAPFELDITDAIHVGENRIEIQVTNLWSNRLIGDKQRDARQIAFATFDTFTAESPLLPAGLLGPVVLKRELAQ